MGASVFTEAERRAWSPLERLTPSQWTERNRILPTSVAAEAGALRLARTPYITGILDAISEQTVEEIVCLKATQIGWSTATESLIGYWIDNDPGPILVVLDSEKTAKEVMCERIEPLIANTPSLQARLSPHAHDQTSIGAKFDSCNLYMAWAGSAGTLARRAIRYLICDEADKYPSNAGRESDPISLASERTSTYGYRRKVLIGSTPTLRSGNVWRAWESSGDRRRYHVPCPHCGSFQPLVFGQIKWPQLSIPDRAIAADTIEQQALAHYECCSCATPIKEHHKPKMLARGCWLSEGQAVDASGSVSGKRPRAKRVGFWINAIYSPWRSFSAIAAEFMRSQSDPTRLQNFRNSWLAEPWEEVIKTSTVEDFRKLLPGAPRAGIVPSWAVFILASADVQGDRLYWIVRAWGAEYKSQLITYGLAANFDDLRKQVLSAQFSLENGGTSRVHALFIDSGYRTDEVYQFAKSDERIKPLKGDNDTQPMLVSQSTAGKEWGVTLYKLNTQLLKDRLSVLRSESSRWLLNDSVSEEYLQHLASEQKQIVNGKERWQTKSDGLRNDYFDCEVYNVAGAEIARVDLLKPIEVMIEAPHAPTQREESVAPSRNTKSSYLGNTSGWLDR